MTDEQVKKINNAINKNDIETVLKTLEIIDLTNEGKKVVENSWNNFISSLRGNFKDEVRDEMLTNIFEASGAHLPVLLILQRQLPRDQKVRLHLLY